MFQVCRDGSPGRRVHAQEGPEVEVPVRAQRQGLLQLGQGRLLMPNLLHDTQQAGHGQLVVEKKSKICCEEQQKD